ncbi:unnamed protein product [Diatraea saccharalis]|uniref:Uncharacterized protein n=1 Tax=Diatraea saccharalis TaxID=40085 RepID=A0A9N9QPQ2_9NEOP|nr:unnamed protein product [Diatraea saccharalis]
MDGKTSGPSTTMVLLVPKVPKEVVDTMSDTTTSDEAGEGSSHSGYRTPKKKIKRVCTFQEDCLKSYSWLKPAKENIKANCTLCQKEFNISHGGKNDINRHQDRIDHKKRKESAWSTISLKQF